MRLPDSDLEKINVCWWGIWPPKQLFFYVKWFHMMRGVNIKCFFTSKTPKNHILVQKVFFFVLSGFWVLGRLFMFLWLWIDLTRSLGCCFLGVLWVENEFLGKKQGPCFSGYYSGWIMGMNRQRVVCLVKIK
jgi:hypothetical protein